MARQVLQAPSCPSKHFLCRKNSEYGLWTLQTLQVFMEWCCRTGRPAFMAGASLVLTEACCWCPRHAMSVFRLLPRWSESCLLLDALQRKDFKVLHTKRPHLIPQLHVRSRTFVKVSTLPCPTHRVGVSRRLATLMKRPESRRRPSGSAAAGGIARSPAAAPTHPAHRQAAQGASFRQSRPTPAAHTELILPKCARGPSHEPDHARVCVGDLKQDLAGPRPTLPQLRAPCLLAPVARPRARRRPGGPRRGATSDGRRAGGALSARRGRTAPSTAVKYRRTALKYWFTNSSPQLCGGTRSTRDWIPIAPPHVAAPSGRVNTPGRSTTCPGRDRQKPTRRAQGKGGLPGCVGVLSLRLCVKDVCFFPVPPRRSRWLSGPWLMLGM